DLPFDPALALGDKNATVVLYEFSDYECPFCRRFAAQTLSRVQKEYVQTGRAALVFRDYPLEDSHPRAFAAATAAQCGSAAGKFWEMNERLLRDPPELSDEALARDARELGIEPAQFERCVNDPATAQRIRAGMREAEGYGVRGTPIFVVGVRKPGDSTVRGLRMIEGAYPFEVFPTTLTAVIRPRQPSPTPLAPLQQPLPGPARGPHSRAARRCARQGATPTRSRGDSAWLGGRDSNPQDCQRRATHSNRILATVTRWSRTFFVQRFQPNAILL